MQSRSALSLLPVLGLVLTIAVVTPAANAATVRYAKPGGTGTTCTIDVPCKLSTAVNNAAAGDEVVLAPGTYTPDVEIQPTNAAVVIHGTPGQPRPVVSVSSSNTAVALSDNSTLSDVEIDQTGTGSALSIFGNNNTAIRVIARATSGTACYGGFGALMRDALCVTSAGGTAFDLNFNGTGVVSTMKVRNLTAIANGSGATAFEIFSYGNGSHMTLDVKNSILSGEIDVRTSAQSGAQTTLTMTTSNYDTINTVQGGTVTPAGTATNQTAAPVFADTTLYHEAGTSPTVDAGAVDADAGTTDLDGDVRQLGTAVDIGADELVPSPPPDTTAPDTALGKKPGKHTRSRKAKFTFTATEAATFLCSLDKKPAKPCASPFKKRVKKVGKHTFSVVAVDVAGNLDPTPAAFKWHVKAKPQRTHR